MSVGCLPQFQQVSDAYLLEPKSERCVPGVRWVLRQFQKLQPQQTMLSRHATSPLAHKHHLVQNQRHTQDKEVLQPYDKLVIGCIRLLFPSRPRQQPNYLPRCHAMVLPPRRQPCPSPPQRPDVQDNAVDFFRASKLLKSSTETLL